MFKVLNELKFELKTSPFINQHRLKKTMVVKWNDFFFLSFSEGRLEVFQPQMIIFSFLFLLTPLRNDGMWSPVRSSLKHNGFILVEYFTILLIKTITAYLKSWGFLSLSRLFNKVLIAYRFRVGMLPEAQQDTWLHFISKLYSHRNWLECPTKSLRSIISWRRKKPPFKRMTAFRPTENCSYKDEQYTFWERDSLLKQTLWSKQNEDWAHDDMNNAQSFKGEAYGRIILP